MAQDECSVVVFGCGNQIMGDDGFGPAVVEALDHPGTLPDFVRLVDAGTGLREYLFDYLLLQEGRPERIIILDAVDVEGRSPGEVFVLDPSQIPTRKIHDFSLHQFPTVNLLAEIEEFTAIKVVVVAVQVEHIPDEIDPGLSQKVKDSVPLACEKIIDLVST